VLSIFLFHGTLSKHRSSFETNGILLGKSKPRLDFGKGFYTSDTERFAKETALNKTAKYNNASEDDVVLPLLIKLQLDDEQYNKLSILEFHKADMDWLMYIIYNRVRPEIQNDMNRQFDFRTDYDIVCGPIADASIATLAYQINTGDIQWHEVQLKNALPFENRNDIQYVFKTDKAIESLTIKEYSIFL